MSEEQEAKAKLARVAEQIARMDAMDDQFDFECPYCFRFTAPGEPFCCGTLMRAVEAILEARDKFSADLTRHLVN
jgi:hypothetical protein